MRIARNDSIHTTYDSSNGRVTPVQFTRDVELFKVGFVFPISTFSFRIAPFC